ncbi:MAG TPA: hypothetical protein VJ546_11495 [Bacillales bacterium]|nr:hypothetical protein [Bacillales bacterium]
METLYIQSKVFIIEKKVTASCLEFLKDNQYLTFELKGENVKNITSFLKYIDGKLPLDPPLDPNGLFNRDAFVDSLWGG